MQPVHATGVTSVDVSSLLTGAQMGHNYTDRLDKVLQAVRVNTFTGEAVVDECEEERVNPLAEDAQHTPRLTPLSELLALPHSRE